MKQRAVKTKELRVMKMMLMMSWKSWKKNLNKKTNNVILMVVPVNYSNNKK